jgi:hypothetical protein
MQGVTQLSVLKTRYGDFTCKKIFKGAQQNEMKRKPSPA